jgi:hypothetical protein
MVGVSRRKQSVCHEASAFCADQRPAFELEWWKTPLSVRTIPLPQSAGASMAEC